VFRFARKKRDANRHVSVVEAPALLQTPLPPAARAAQLHANPAAPLMLACWSLGEVVRYPWYAATAANACPGWLTWLR
jgi:hypothetical protein